MKSKWLAVAALLFISKFAYTAALSPTSQADAGVSTLPVSLAGIWSLDASADFDMYSNADILSYYQPYSTTLPQGSTFLGFSIWGRYHFNNDFYVGPGFDWLSKGFSITNQQVDSSGNTSTVNQAFQWNALYPNLLLGWSFFRGLNSFLGLEASLGPVLLTQSSYQESGAASSQASFGGASFGGQLGIAGAWFIIPCLSAEFLAAYRQAYLGNITINSSDPTAPVAPVNGQSAFVDFSGPIVRVGLGLYFGMKNPWGDLSEPGAASPPFAAGNSVATSSPPPMASPLAQPAGAPLPASPIAR